MSDFVAPNGVLAVYKPKGFTSFDVVAKVRGTLQRAIRRSTNEAKKKIKVGHGGTLDPAATGVLVLGIGTGCRELESYLAGPKGYRATGMLGAETDTLDTEGNVTAEAGWDHVTREGIEAALCEFQGDIMQSPPMYSAIKMKGRRLYDLARAGIYVERERRPVTIHNLALTFFEPPTFGLDVECGGGTYIRSLIADIARHERVRSVAHVTELERTQHGIFALEHCLHQPDWTPGKIGAHVEYCRELLTRRGPTAPPTHTNEQR